MKNLFLLTSLLLIFSVPANAQIWDKLKKAAEEKATDILTKKSKKETKRTSKSNKSSNGRMANKVSNAVEVWRNYKFIPGEEVIFYDNLKFEEVGEFPSRWDLREGGAEVAAYDGEKVIIGTAKYENKIFPSFNKNTYLSDEFTIEFDVYVDELSKGYNNSSIDYDIYLTHANLHSRSSSVADIELELGSGKTSGYVVKYDFQLEQVSIGRLSAWHHVALSYNKGNLKLYYDEKRIANIPNLSITPDLFGINMASRKDSQFDRDLLFGIRNIRIANGGGQMYKRIIADGNYVTNGIIFDSGKDIIKSQSMGVINKIVTILNENKDWKFKITGHTDSDGNDAENVTLSKKRAEAVKEALVKQGINKSRLICYGKGESELLFTGNSNEDKANNRRVEFVKQ